MIRVLLADDHGVIRDGLGRLISALDDIELAGVAADGAEAVERARALQPDVVLMDLDMPLLDGIEATRRIVRRAAADRRARADLVLRPPADPGRARGRRVRLPAQGRRRRGGRRGHPRRRARRVAARPARGAHGPRRARRRPTRSPALSPREREVLALLVEGLPNKLIARRLEITEKTVKSHLTRDLPRARRHRPHAGGAVGRAPRHRPRLVVAPGRTTWSRSDRDQGPMVRARQPRHRHGDARPPPRTRPRRGGPGGRPGGGERRRPHEGIVRRRRVLVACA